MHPGDCCGRNFLTPLGLTPYAVAKACGVPRTRIERIAREELGISADTALRMAKFLGTSAEFWLNLQTRYDILTAERALAKELKRIEPLKRVAA
jgi:addiction module HigA family antidote